MSPPGFGVPPTPNVPDSWSPLGGGPTIGTSHNADPFATPQHYSGPTPTAGNPFGRPPTGAHSQGNDGQNFGHQQSNGSHHGGWAAGFGTNLGPWHEKDWTVGEKVSRELKSFDGQIAHNGNWRNRIRDHFISTNVYYGEVFYLVEKSKFPLALALLGSSQIPSLPNLNWRWIASHVWSFVGKWMTDSQLKRRVTLSGGEALCREYGRIY